MSVDRIKLELGLDDNDFALEQNAIELESNADTISLFLTTNRDKTDGGDDFSDYLFCAVVTTSGETEESILSFNLDKVKIRTLRNYLNFILEE